MSQGLLQQVLTNGAGTPGSERVDVVFDLYQYDLIKSAEHISRDSEDGINQIKPGHRIKILNEAAGKH